MKSEKKIKYYSGDKLKLTGIMSIPNDPSAFVLMAHGIMMNKNEWNNLHFRIVQDLFSENIASLRFDYRGHGESKGEQKEMTVVGEFLDVEASAKEISKTWNNKISIVASSFGAGSSILYAFLNPEKINSLILLNPVLDYEATFLNPLVDWAKDTFNKKGYKRLEEKGYMLLDGEWQLGAKLIAEFKIIKPWEYLNKIKCPVLTIHGNQDEMVPFEISKKYGKPNEKSEFISIKNADHGFVHVGDEEGTGEISMKNQKNVTQLLIEWIEKWT